MIFLKKKKKRTFQNNTGWKIEKPIYFKLQLQFRAFPVKNLLNVVVS